MFIPFRDENPIYIFPIVTVLVIGLNVLVFGYELYLMPEPAQLHSFYFMWGMIPARVIQYFSLGAVLTVFSSMFIHGGWMHLIGNMLYLWIFGNNVEAHLGSVPYLLFYVVCGIMAEAAHIAVNPASPVPTIGASGAIAGVLGAYIVTFPRARIRTLVFFGLIRIITLPAIVVLGFWFVLQLFSGVGSLGAQTGGGIAYFAHIGGFVGGALLMGLFKLVEGKGD